MRALVLKDHDTAPEIADIARPDPATNEVRIRVVACGLNFADLLMIKGTYQDTPTPPFVPGMEVAGVIERCGAGVTGLAPGARVAAFTGAGGLAEFVTCPAAHCLALPDAMTMDQAAAFQIAYGTSHLALDHKARLQPGETLLVLGAAGGVGLTAVEIGAQMGARVVAVARGADRLAIARAAGADVTLDSDNLDLRAACRDLGGVDVVYDAIGEPLSTPALRSLNPEGRFLTIGFAGGKVPQFAGNLLLVKNISVLGLYWGGYLRFAPDVLTGSLRTLLDWFAAGRITPHVGAVLPFARGAEGLDLLRNRRATGKVVIRLDT